MGEFWIVRGAGMISIHADPMHLAMDCDLLFADNRNVVLRLAGNRAGVTANAGVKIDNHRPLVAFVGKFIGLIECFIEWRKLVGLLRIVRIGKKFLERSIVQNPPIAGGIMMLRTDERIFLAGFSNCEAVAKPKRIGRS